MFKVYITKELLINFFINESDCPETEHSDWYKILKEQKYIGLDDYNPDEKLDMDSPLAIILRRFPHMSFSCERENIKKITDGDQKSVLNINPCGVYLLNISVDAAKKIRKQFGVICESAKTLGKTFLLNHHTLPGANKDGTTWDSFRFSSYIPTNALIIQDRYFFKSDRGETIQDTFENFRKIIWALLPDADFSSVYHLMVIVDGTKIEERDKLSFGEIASKLNHIKTELKEERGYDICLEVLSIPEHSYNYDKTHNRNIISNYFSIWAPHKLKAFRGTESLAAMNTIVCDFLFHHLNEEDVDYFIRKEKNCVTYKEWMDIFRGIMPAVPLSGTTNKFNPIKKNRDRNVTFPPINYKYSINGEMKFPPKIINRLLTFPDDD